MIPKNTDFICNYTPLNQSITTFLLRNMKFSQESAATLLIKIGLTAKTGRGTSRLFSWVEG